MTDKVIFTHVSGKALKGIRSVAGERDVEVLLSPDSGLYTVVVTGSPKSEKARRRSFAKSGRQHIAA